MNDRELVARLLVRYLDLVQERHETESEHDPENVRGCTHARCLAAMFLAARVLRALNVSTQAQLEELADG